MMIIAAGQIHEIPFPFCHDKYNGCDEDGPFTTTTWRPGVLFDQVDEYQGEAYAEGMGHMVLTVIDVFKPGKYPQRVFYTRQWKSPDGKLFGKTNLRIIATSNFKAMLRGYRHPFTFEEQA